MPIRDGESLIQVENSGLEVWLYDDANRERIVASGAAQTFSDASLGPLFADGLLCAYSLWQDDGCKDERRSTDGSSEQSPDVLT